jgi:hypothetical protein
MPVSDEIVLPAGRYATSSSVSCTQCSDKAWHPFGVTQVDLEWQLSSTWDRSPAGHPTLPTMSISGRARQAGWLLAILLAAGCGNSVAGLASAGSFTAPPTTTTTTTSSSAPVTTTTTTTTPPPPATAADGTNYKACRDGTCEVAIGGPVKIAVDGGTFNVTKVSVEDGVEFQLSLSGGSWSGTFKGNCGSVFQFYLGGGMQVVTCGADGPAAPPTPTPGALSMQLAGYTADGAAVIRMVS